MLQCVIIITVFHDIYLLIVMPMTSFSLLGFIDDYLILKYKKNEGISNVKARVNPNTGEIKLYTYRTVIEKGPEDEFEIDEDIEPTRKYIISGFCIVRK